MKKKLGKQGDGSRSTGRSKRSRRGGILYEATLAIALSAVVLVGLLQLLGLVAQQRRSAEQRFIAMIESGNAMEVVMTRSWSALTTEQLAQMQPSDFVRQRLPDAKLKIETLPAGEENKDRRIIVQLDWDNGHGRGNPLRLVAWRLQPSEAAP